MPSLGQRQRAQAAAAPASAGPSRRGPKLVTALHSKPTTASDGSSHDELAADMDGHEDEHSEDDGDELDSSEVDDLEDDIDSGSSDDDEEEEEQSGSEDEDDEELDYPFHLHLLEVEADAISLLWAAAPVPSSVSKASPTEGQGHLRNTALAVTVNGQPWPHLYLTELSPAGDHAVLVVHELNAGAETNLVVHSVPLDERAQVVEHSQDESPVFVSFDAPAPLATAKDEVANDTLDIDMPSLPDAAVDSRPLVLPTSEEDQSNDALPSPLTLDALQKALTLSTQQRDGLLASLRKGRKESSRLESALRNEIDTLQRNLDRLAAADGRTRQKILALQETVRQAKAAEDRLGQEANTAQAELEERQARMGLSRAERAKDSAEWEQERSREEARIRAREDTVKEDERRCDKLRSEAEDREKKRERLDAKWAKVASLEEELRRLKDEVASAKGATPISTAVGTNSMVPQVVSPTASSASSDPTPNSTLRATAPAFFAPRSLVAGNQTGTDDGHAPSGSLTPRTRMMRDQAMRRIADDASASNASIPSAALTYGGGGGPGSGLDPHKPEFVPTWLQPASSASQDASDVEGVPGYSHNTGRPEDYGYAQYLHMMGGGPSTSEGMNASMAQQPFLGPLPPYGDFRPSMGGPFSTDATTTSTSPVPLHSRPQEVPLVHGNGDAGGPPRHTEPGNGTGAETDPETDAETVDGDDLDFDPTLKLPPSFARSRQLLSSANANANGAGTGAGAGPGPGTSAGRSTTSLQRTTRPRSIILSSPVLSDLVVSTSGSGSGSIAGHAPSTAPPPPTATATTTALHWRHLELGLDGYGHGSSGMGMMGMGMGMAMGGGAGARSSAPTSPAASHISATAVGPPGLAQRSPRSPPGTASAMTTAAGPSAPASAPLPSFPASPSPSPSPSARAIGSGSGSPGASASASASGPAYGAPGQTSPLGSASGPRFVFPHRRQVDVDAGGPSSSSSS